MESDLVGVLETSFSAYACFVAKIHSGKWDRVFSSSLRDVWRVIEATFSTCKFMPFSVFEMDPDFILSKTLDHLSRYNMMSQRWWLVQLLNLLCSQIEKLNSKIIRKFTFLGVSGVDRALLIIIGSQPVIASLRVDMVKL